MLSDPQKRKLYDEYGEEGVIRLTAPRCCEVHLLIRDATICIASHSPTVSLARD